MSVSVRRTTTVRSESNYSWDNPVQEVVDALSAELLSDGMKGTGLTVTTEKKQYGRIKVVAKLSMVNT